VQSAAQGQAAQPSGKRLNHRARSSDSSPEEQIADDPSRRVSGVQAKAARSASSPPEASLPGSPPLISIGSPASESLLEPTYAYLSVYAFTAFAPRVAERLNVAIYELYSNALRYGSNAGEVRLELSRTQSGQGALLRVSNCVDAEGAGKLQSQLSRVLTDPAAAFTTEMNRFASASQPPPMLGLVRVAHESSLRLELRSEGSRIEISTQVEP
jgi:signal transduction histidine kinase